MQTQMVINVSALPCLLALLSTPKKGIRKEACWAISNITAGNKEQIQHVFDALIIPPLIQLLANAEFDIKKEASWAVSNATSGGTPEQIRHLVEQGCIKPMCDLLLCQDNKIITVCLEGLENILRVGEKERELTNRNPFAEEILDCDGVEKIEQLQSHPNNDVYQKAVHILEVYFHAEEEDADTSLVPGMDVSQQHYQFGQPPPSAPGGQGPAPFSF